jgi:hypothetical protein
MKTRIEFNDTEKAIDHARFNGGWIAKAKRGVFWYSFEHTQSEICSDLPGGLKVGMWPEFTEGERALNRETGLSHADLPDGICMDDYLNEDGTIDYDLLAEDVF